jgi:hypothetical protein
VGIQTLMGIKEEILKTLKGFCQHENQDKSQI